jgi:beta-glucanase (GH16 family)
MPGEPVRRRRDRPSPLLAGLVLVMVTALGLLLSPQALRAAVSQETRTAVASTSDPGGGSVAPRPDAAPAGFPRLVFSDEFDSGELDGRKWLASRDGYRSGAFNPNKEGAYFDPENVTVAGGQLHLTLRDAPGTRVWGKTYAWSSGAVTTQGTFAFGDNSFVAARIRLPTSDGLWPAFWTAVAGRWPPETDIFEFFGTQQQARPRFNYHPPTRAHGGSRLYGETDVDYRQGWHTYGLLRQGGVLTPFVDGVAYPEASVTGGDSLQHYLILNLSAYAGHDPEPGSSMAVDWVRVWTS